MALNADERCEVLKSFSAKFYDTAEECEDIPKTLEEGYQRGKACYRIPKGSRAKT
ncbi:hypothetical protein F4802DRAFT_598898 [Xylaria palmicola]|nr:hypothetical protein F4802DRAFT_598898 [Xylaria palmicola]